MSLAHSHTTCSTLQGGVTEEQVLKLMGAKTTLLPKEAVRFLEVFNSSICILLTHTCTSDDWWPGTNMSSLGLISI